MNWDDLRLFLAVAQRGSTRRAAEALDIHHSTVARRIEAFEEANGVRLFIRTPAGYSLTPAGEALVQEVESVADRMAGIERSILGQDARLSGELRVTMHPALMSYLCVPDLIAFMDRYPGIDIELIASSEVLDLTRREADIAIRVTDRPAEHLVGRRMLQLARAAYASRAYLRTHDPIDAPEQCQWIGWNDRIAHPQWIRQTDYPAIAVRGRFNSLFGQIAAAKAGFGMALLPCFIGDQEPDLVRVPPGTTRPYRHIWLLTHRDIASSVRVRAFMDFSADALHAHSDLVEGRRPRP